MLNHHISDYYETIQGEGTRTGRPSLLIRFSGCNLLCDWCDTPIHPPTNVPFEDILNHIEDKTNQGYDLIITGGEPMLYQSEIAKIVMIAKQSHNLSRITIETNGTFLPTDELVRLSRDILWSVSPKLPSSGNPCLSTMYEWCDLPNIQFKFVLGNLSSDLNYLKHILDSISYHKPIYLHTVAYPTDSPEIYLHRVRALALLAKDLLPHHNIRVGVQLHKLLWGFDTEGV